MQRSLDIAAISISGLCAVHCLLTPVALILFPILSGSLIASEDFHRFILWVILPTSGVAMFLGCRRHNNFSILVMGGAGLFLLVLSAFWVHDWVGEWGERLLTLVGGAILAAGHVRNYLLCRDDRCHAARPVRDRHAVRAECPAASGARDTGGQLRFHAPGRHSAECSRLWNGKDSNRTDGQGRVVVERRLDDVDFGRDVLHRLPRVRMLMTSLEGHRSACAEPH